MKRLVLFCGILSLFFLVACNPKTPVTYDVTLLYGEWVEGSVHDHYDSDGTGYTWDTDDDITEEEATPFEWNLTNDQLLVMHKLFNGTVVPKSYTVTRLDNTSLVIEDDYGNEHLYLRSVTDDLVN